VVKCVAAIRVFAYGCSADTIDDHVCIGEDTILEVVRTFVEFEPCHVFGFKFIWFVNFIFIHS
jgi:hypothetical protein